MDYKYDISFIIPAYNVGEYISETIDSILMQTNVNKQIIIVNDGSKDRTSSVCQEYVDKYSFITLVNKENEGVSVARNVGIQMAEAEYICFMDGDDIYFENFAEKFLKYCRKYNLDIIRGQYKYFTNESCGTPLPAKTMSGGVPMSGTDYLHETMRQHCNEVVTVLGFYKTSFVRSNNICFPPGISYTEDQIFYIKSLLVDGCKLLDLPVCFYGYRMRNGSACNSGYSSKKVHDIEFTTRQELGLCKLFEKSKNDIIRFATNTAAQFFTFYKYGNKEQKGEVLDVLRPLNSLSLMVFAYRNKIRVKLFLAMFCPRLLNLFYR